jgi:hypothetical protein
MYIYIIYISHTYNMLFSLLLFILHGVSLKTWYKYFWCMSAPPPPYRSNASGGWSAGRSYHPPGAQLRKYHLGLTFKWNCGSKIHELSINLDIYIYTYITCILTHTHIYIYILNIVYYVDIQWYETRKQKPWVHQSVSASFRMTMMTWSSCQLHSEGFTLKSRRGFRSHIRLTSWNFYVYVYHVYHIWLHVYIYIYV